MNESEFWSLIEKSKADSDGDGDLQVELLTQWLHGAPGPGYFGF